MSAVGVFLLLQRRKAVELRNRTLDIGLWEWVKSAMFGLTGLALLAGLYIGFLRALRYLETVQLIGGLITWKLTGMALLMTFWMVVISNLIAAISTLYYANDLPFLLAAPSPPRAVFLAKAIEASVYASWMVSLALVPFILALTKAKGLGVGFALTAFALQVPLLALAAAIGIGATLLLMYYFPSSRTRDAVWMLSSAGVAAIYIVIRFAEPERLVRPDMLEQLAQYLAYLQAPTARYFPSWWTTECLMAYAAGRPGVFAAYGALLVGGMAAAYGVMTWLSGWMYPAGVSGAQEGRRRGRRWDMAPYAEEFVARRLPAAAGAAVLLWKDRKLFSRDVKQWSQLMLITALIVVYLFSVWRLPLDTSNLKSLFSFLNIGAAGGVLAALALRFAFPAVSLEGKAYWVVRSAPVSIGDFLVEKLVGCAVPMTFLGALVIAVTNRILQADRFVSWLSFGSIVLITWTLCGMGVAFGAIFPNFDVENIHQIESSAGGFAFMACALGYVGATVAIEAWVVQDHFLLSLGKAAAWDRQLAGGTALALLALNLVAFCVPWAFAIKLLDAYEGEG